jgi:hypothetical protein
MEAVFKSVVITSGSYDSTRTVDGLEFELLHKHAKYRHIQIVIHPGFGCLDKQLDKWRRKFTQYVLGPDDKDFMKKLYFFKNQCHRYKNGFQKGAIGFGNY